VSGDNSDVDENDENNFNVSPIKSNNSSLKRIDFENGVRSGGQWNVTGRGDPNAFNRNGDVAPRSGAKSAATPQ
jgi:hypothetical protein